MKLLITWLCGKPPEKDDPSYNVESLRYGRKVFVRYYGLWNIAFVAAVLVWTPTIFLVAPALLIALWVMMLSRLTGRPRAAEAAEPGPRPFSR